ncbi:MerR family copper efflux transcriptional regulator [Mesocricetibacter intestinalis]|uniref:HTH-type transcriptional regulator CueR n=1 Tax=Mesocricetibacter intestinalis TaxID=1521930 RepID=A0A4R6VAW8_9PAST|nr:Cu(I)-responsive transcriptional regulator [Mesocricetibacter intestinalis]TDQ57134.1 MerR family copper efflux transcriptional regulator [Mesocricetibacter intestinalis]
MNIAEIVKRTGLSAKSVRFYEEKGIITPPQRAANGYRQYNEEHIRELNLLHQARLVGFSLPECKELMQLYNNPHRRSADVKGKTLAKINEIDQQIAKLQQIRQELLTLAEQCPGDNSEHCPIIEGLACKKCGQKN